MRKQLIGVLTVILLSVYTAPSTKAQTIELLAGNTLNGAVNGTLLGGATMALTDNPDFDPLRIGLGLGTLYGIGAGALDISKSGGSPIVVSGIFNDGNNTSIIVLLDTFYGAAAGAVIASSVMLVADEPLVNGLQYGAGVGAWVGFGFGLIDAFALSEHHVAEPVSQSQFESADGLFALNLKNGTSVGLISPSIFTSYNSDFSRTYNPALQMVHLKLTF